MPFDVKSIPRIWIRGSVKYNLQKFLLIGPWEWLKDLFPRKIKKNVLISFLDELLARSQCHSSTDLPRSHYLAHYVHSNLGYQCSAPACFLHKGHWCLDRSKYKPLKHIHSNFPPKFGYNLKQNNYMVTWSIGAWCQV